MMIESLLDNDLYKFTMGQIAFLRFPEVEVRYKSRCRNIGIEWPDNIVWTIKENILKLETLKFTDNEIGYLESLGYFKPSYLEFLRNYKMDSSRYVAVSKDRDGKLSIEITGPWFLTIYFEVPILAIIGQAVREYNDKGEIMQHAMERLALKCRTMDEDPSMWNFKFADFGTRRRFSRVFHKEAVASMMKYPDRFIGTSNVHLARILGLTPIGTMAHEFIQLGQGLDINLRDSQKHMLQVWADEYRGKLSIALTDTIGIDAFLRDFDYYFAKLYDGLRHDSGDPFVWAKKVLKHYRDMGIDPLTKKLVFSDKLDFDTAQQIQNIVGDQAQVSFGIGTYLVNDTSFPALQNVIKLVEVNGRPVAKVSDEPGKSMCEDAGFLTHLIRTFER